MNRQFFRLAGVALCALFASVGAWAQNAASNVGSGAAGSNVISAEVSQQVAAIGAIKASFSPAEKKLDSHLSFGVLAAKGDPRVASFMSAIAPVGASTPSAAPGPGSRPGLTKPVTVNIFGTITGETVDAVVAVKGIVNNVSSTGRMMNAAVPLGALATIAARPDVTRIALPSRARTNVSARNGNGQTTVGQRSNGPQNNAGAVTSQGYIAHRANVVVNGMGITGAGVTVGVLSDSASAGRIAALIATGDLPAGAHALPGQDGAPGTDEGAAIMEIIHDMAPGANIIFATAFTSEQSFADNIRALAAAGCKVIVDDVSYSDEGVFQDSVIAQAVNDVTALGVIYFSSAANSGSKTFGTSGTWEGDFLDGGPVSGVLATAGETGEFHNFNTVASPQNFDRLTSTTDDITLSWSDPLDVASNDYDLFILNSAGTALIDFSANTQDGSPGSQPFEEVFEGDGHVNTVFPTNARIVVVKFNGVARALHVDNDRGTFQINTAGNTHGHNAARNAVSMAAVYWGSAGKGSVPFTGGTANPDEPFSSDGPRKIFYNPDGSAITPGNFLFATNGGETLQKPDFAAADGAVSMTPGFEPFFGTSAAGPHAAAIAALILQARPDYTIAQIITAMKASALDTMESGPDRDSGYGIPMANTAVQYALTH